MQMQLNTFDFSRILPRLRFKNGYRAGVYDGIPLKGRIDHSALYQNSHPDFKLFYRRRRFGGVKRPDNTD
jgi:hypothetical protein